MIMRYFLFFICLLLPFHSHTQSFIDFEYKNGHTTCVCNDITAQKILDTLDNIKDERFLACCYHCIGIDYYYEEKDWVAIEFYKKALKIREQYQDDLLWKSYRNLGYAYKQTSHYERAVEALLKGLEVSDKLKETTTYRYLGESYIELGEFENAVEALENSARLAEDDYELAEANNALCIALTRTQDTTNLLKALKHAEKAIELFKRESDIEGVAIAYLNKGNVHEELKQHEAAIQAYNQAKAIFLQENRTLYLAKTINNIATTRCAQGQYNEAIEQLNQSLKIKKEYYENDAHQYTYAANYENLAENYEALDDIDKALRNYQLTLINLTDNFRNQDISANPEVASAYYIYNKSYLLQVLDLKAQAALKSGDIELAYNIYQELDNWINEFYKDLSTNESKLTWIARAHNMYSHAIEVALKKDDKEKAFEYAEKARAVLLWQSHSQQAALSLLDDEERENYDDLLTQIRQADFEYRDATDEDKKQLKSRLDSLNRQFDQFEKTLEQKNPEYARRKYQPKTINPNDVQTNMLSDNTALIEYHWSADDMLYIFTLTKNEIHIDTVQVDDDFHRQIQEFHTAIKDMNLPDVITPGYPVYQTAFEPIRAHLNDNIQKIILLPDGKLNYIPFEALPTKNNDKPYLIDEYTFNYLYSCSSYGSSSVTGSIDEALFIAPEFGEKDDLPPLSDTRIANWLNYSNLIKLTNREPTYEKVVNEVANADMIHIHAHAQQGTRGTGKIHLYAGDELSQNDIQEMPLKARHVVLSACETGTGELNQGEGVLSLGWSFVYRGVPSVVMSLWKVNDNSTSTIMENYYQLLNQKIPADEALRQAKLQLKSSADVHQHPYHWAAFIHTGNPPTKERGTVNYLYILGALLGLFLVVYLVRKR